MRAIVIPPLSEIEDRAERCDRVASWLLEQGVDQIAWAPGTRSDAVEWTGFVTGEASGSASEPEGAASAIARVRHKLGNDPLLVVGSDVRCAFDLEGITMEHDVSPAIATVAVLPVDADEPAGNVEVDRAGRILRLTASRRGETMGWLNARAYVVEPRLFESVPSDANWGIEGDLFALVLRSHGILGGFKIREGRPLVSGPCGAAHA